MSKGIPRTANKYTDINGIKLNFRTPLVHSLALGGGTIVEVERNKVTLKPQVRLMKDSIAFRLTEDGVSF